jgi:hypothetical protein
MIRVTSSSTWQKKMRVSGPTPFRRCTGDVYPRHDTNRNEHVETAYLHIFQGILLPYASQNILLAALLKLASEQYLVEDVIGLGKGEYYVEFAYVAIVFIHLFDISMNDLEGN